MAESDNYKRYKALHELFRQANPNKSKAAVQEECNRLWTDLKKQPTENYNQLMIRLQDQAKLCHSRSLMFWAKLPKQTEGIFCMFNFNHYTI